MLINIHPPMGRDEIEIEKDFKMIKEFYLRRQEYVFVLAKNVIIASWSKSLASPDTFHSQERFNKVILSEEYSRTRPEQIIKDVSKKNIILKNIILKDTVTGDVALYIREKSESERFSEAVADLF